MGSHRVGHDWSDLAAAAWNKRGFPGGSDGKESACSAGNRRDAGSTPGSGRSPGAGPGNPLQYSCLKNPWTEEPGGLHSIRSQRVGYDWSDLAGRHEIKAMVNMRLFASEDLLNSPFLPALAFHWSYHLTYKLSSFSHPRSWTLCLLFLPHPKLGDWLFRPRWVWTRNP